MTVTRPFWCCVFAPEGAGKFVNLFLGFLLHDSVAFLNFADQLIAATVDYGEVVVREFSPVFLSLVRILLPFSFHLIPVHRSLLIFIFLYLITVRTCASRESFRTQQGKISTPGEQRTYGETLKNERKGGVMDEIPQGLQDSWESDRGSTVWRSPGARLTTETNRGRVFEHRTKARRRDSGPTTDCIGTSGG